MRSVVARMGCEIELLGWDEICARYPDQWVCLRDVTFTDDRREQVHAARVGGHGETPRIACEAGGAIADCFHTGAVVEVRHFGRLELSDDDREFVRSRW